MVFIKSSASLNKPSCSHIIVWYLKHLDLCSVSLTSLFLAVCWSPPIVLVGLANAPLFEGRVLLLSNPLTYVSFHSLLDGQTVSSDRRIDVLPPSIFTPGKNSQVLLGFGSLLGDGYLHSHFQVEASTA